MPTCQNNMHNSRHSGCALPYAQGQPRGTGVYGSRNSSRRPMPVPPNTSGSVSPRTYSGNDCCHAKNDALEGMPVAMAYVPWQQWQNIYEICRGFERGTIFEDLDKPFRGKGGRRQ